MTDRVSAGPVENGCRPCESVAIHTKKVYASCRDKDCIEDLRFYPTTSAQEILLTAQAIKGGEADLLYVYTDVKPVNFNRGFYTIDMRFFYRVSLQAATGSPRYTEIEGLCVFDKRVILYGGEGGAKVFTSQMPSGVFDRDTLFAASLPTAVVEAVSPIVLDTRLIDCSQPMQTECSIAEVPAGVAAAFAEPLILNLCGSTGRCAFVTLGQFSIVRLERDTHLCIPVYDYCIPENECVADSGSSEDPCELFDSVEFPIHEFFPPGKGSGISDCACGS